MDGVVSTRVQFRAGETETMGFIEQVSYKIKRNQVIVGYDSGPMKGTAIRYTVTGPNSIHSELGNLQRIN